MTASNVYERTIERIDKALSKPIDEENRRVLSYIRGQITVEGQERRPELHKAVDHLLEVAKQRLRAFEPKRKAV